MSSKSDLIKQKIKAGGIHFLLSLVVISSYLSIVFLLWYPDPYATLEKVVDAAKIVVGVDLVLGPLLTFLLYKKNKPGLKLDLSMVVLFQITALSWGVYVTYEQRPVYIAYAEEMFSVVAASDLKGKRPEDSALQAQGWGDQKIVYVELPKEAKEKVDLLFRHPNAYTLVDRYRDYQDYIEEILKASIDMPQRIEDYPEMQEPVNALLKKHKKVLDDIAFIPVEGRKALAFIVLNRADGKLLDILVDQ